MSADQALSPDFPGVPYCGRLAPASIPMDHRNPGLELVLMRQGRAVWQIEGRRVGVQRGDVFFTWPWQRHGGSLRRESGCAIDFFIVRLASESARDRLALDGCFGSCQADSVAVLEDLRGRQKQCLRADASSVWLMRHVVSVLLAGEAPGVEIAALILALLSGLGRCPVAEEEGDDALVQELLVRLRAAPQDQWSLADMADCCGLGMSQLCRRFRLALGESPIQRLRRLRVEMACGFLREHDASITDVALRCGFGSSQYFSRVFREFMGCSAAEWRADPRSLIPWAR